MRQLEQQVVHKYGVELVADVAAGSNVRLPGLHNHSSHIMQIVQEVLELQQVAPGRLAIDHLCLRHRPIEDYRLVGPRVAVEQQLPSMQSNLVGLLAAEAPDQPATAAAGGGTTAAG